MHDILRLSTDVMFASHPGLRVQAPAECDHTCAERGEAASRPRRMGRRVHGSHHQMLGKSISTKLYDTFFLISFSPLFFFTFYSHRLSFAYYLILSFFLFFSLYYYFKILNFLKHHLRLQRHVRR